MAGGNNNNATMMLNDIPLTLLNTLKQEAGLENKDLNALNTQDRVSPQTDI